MGWEYKMSFSLEIPLDVKTRGPGDDMPGPHLNPALQRIETFIFRSGAR
jgi:hypothetical protein